MPSWKKVIVSGSDAILNDITLSGGISNTSGDFTIDIEGDLNLDANGADIVLKDDGTAFGRFKRDSSDFVIKAESNNKDIVFRGQDGGATITAMTIDMSEGGIAEFAAQIRAPSQATSAPTFAFTNDTDTGISRPTTNALNIVTGGTERVRVDAEGNIEFGSQKQNTNWSQFFNALSGNYGSHISMQNNNVPVISVGNNFYINNSTANERILAYPTQQLKLHIFLDNKWNDKSSNHMKDTQKMIIDIFANSKEIKIFKKKKILTKNLHGTGCSLSSAIATYYSCGKTLKKSCELAINYVNHAITNSPNYGKGNGPINHLASIKINKKYL